MGRRCCSWAGLTFCHPPHPLARRSCCRAPCQVANWVEEALLEDVVKK